MPNEETDETRVRTGCLNVDVSICIQTVVGLRLEGPEAKLKRGPSDDVIILSQP